MKFLLPTYLFAIAAVAAFGQTADTKPASQSGLDLSAIDKTADPCTDFYQYACGNWLKNNPIPSDQSRWGRFTELHERNLKILRQLAEESEAATGASALNQKVGDFYGSCIAEDEVEQQGTKPIQPELKNIAAINSNKALVKEVARLQNVGAGAFFEFGSSPDPDNAKMEMAGIDQGGLGLPERDYYFRKDAHSVELRRKYVAHVAKMFELIGVTAADARKKADTIMQIETDLAQGSLDVVQRRDPKKLVHKYKEAQLAGLSPNFDLKQYFTDLDAPSFAVINIATPDFMKAMSQVITKYKFDGVKDYLTYHYLTASASALPKAFVDENFDFYGKTLTGVKELKPRWKRCVQMTDRELGEALGKKFVEKTFGEQGKARTLEMVNEIEHEMAKDIEAVSWMSPETKKQALIKLKGVTNKIGYPDKWRDYSTVNIVRADYLGNIERANEFENKRDLKKIGKPVDKAEWEMTPPTVNAYYDPTENNINFPAGILQPPFYSNKADSAVNYGGIGAVVGHELTHGFDDEGRQFDANGNLRDWWQKQDEEAFNKLADCVVKEYSSFEPLPGININGKLTLGENTADNGGMRLAYMALEDSLAKHTETKQKEDGYTTQQRFFLGYGQVWCVNQRPEMEEMLVKTDPHSPGKYRVNGTVKNMESFTQAWGCKPDQAMFAAPGKSCRVW